MSLKYKLVQDKENDGLWASIRRHITVASLLIALPIVALVALTIISISAEVRKQAVRDNNQRIAVMTQKAMPTRAPWPTSTPQPGSTPNVSAIGAEQAQRSTPQPTIQNQTPLRTGPGLDYGSAGSIAKGNMVVLVARDATGEWYQLDSSLWIAANAVTGKIPDLPIK